MAGTFKIGSQLFTAAGPAAVEKIAGLGVGIFLDLKFHDIPKTIAGAVAVVVSLPRVRFLDIHTLGGFEMMRAAARAVRARPSAGGQRPRLLGITILTSLDGAALRRVGISGRPELCAVRLARLAQEAGLDGVVASAHEVRRIRRACGEDFLVIVPGVRPVLSGAAAGSQRDDQARVATPAEAIRAGADYLVVGRPITGAADQRAAAQSILAQIESALARGILARR